MKDLRMGNEESNSVKFDVEDEAVEVTDNWSLHCASSACDDLGSPGKWSAFVSQPGLGRTRLEGLAKNLMVHRHPCILKYISSWSKNNKFYLVTEEVKPLAQVLTTQSTLQICIGLHSVLTALMFLHDKASASHNNVCCASVYVTPEGIWKLAGLDYLKKLHEVTQSYLRETRSRRYERAIPPNEESSIPINPIAIDQFAYGVLADELLRKRNDDDITSLADFREVCKKNLQHSDHTQRPPLQQVLHHPFFCHDFIKIHGFLVELPLKNDSDKEKFFRNLTEQLSSLPECIVASQLVPLLLSRIVLLDLMAQQHLLPIILTPKKGTDYQSDALFSESTFMAFVVPRLLQMFCVRDSSVRLLLLRHFHLFCGMFNKDQLQHQILPELLVAIKDTNDELVSWTLRALSDLVPVLGAAIVIGGKRGKLFADGRPGAVVQTSRTGQVALAKEGCRKGVNVTRKQLLPERPSPDGGEDNSSSVDTVEVDLAAEEDEVTLEDIENWSDWDVASESKSSPEAPGAAEQPVSPIISTNVEKGPLPDIDDLDIKNSLNKKSSTSIPEEMNFFQDMEPVISRPSVFQLEEQVTRSKFDVAVDSGDGGVGWDDDSQDWSIS